MSRASVRHFNKYKIECKRVDGVNLGKGRSKQRFRVASSPERLEKTLQTKFPKNRENKEKAKKKRNCSELCSCKQEMQRKNAHEFTLEKALRKRDADVSAKVVDN